MHAHSRAPPTTTRRASRWRCARNREQHGGSRPGPAWAGHCRGRTSIPACLISLDSAAPALHRTCWPGRILRTAGPGGPGRPVTIRATAARPVRRSEAPVARGAGERGPRDPVCTPRAPRKKPFCRPAGPYMTRAPPAPRAAPCARPASRPAPRPAPPPGDLVRAFPRVTREHARALSHSRTPRHHRGQLICSLPGPAPFGWRALCSGSGPSGRLERAPACDGGRRTAAAARRLRLCLDAAHDFVYAWARRTISSMSGRRSARFRLCFDAAVSSMLGRRAAAHDSSWTARRRTAAWKRRVGRARAGPAYSSFRTV